MKPIKLLFLLVFTSNILIAQDIDDIPTYPDIRLNNQHHKDSLGNYENQFYASGKPKLTYEFVTDSTFIRTNFREIEDSYTIVECNKRFRVDTTASLNKNGEYQIVINVGPPLDIPHGHYKEVYKNELINEGNIINNKRTGKWIMRSGSIKNIVNFNDKGQVCGEYSKYKLNTNKEEILICKGMFSEIDYVTTIFDFKTYTEKEKILKKIKRTGIWEYYNLEGKLIGRTEYKWF